jgi:hypothetical protein
MVLVSATVELKVKVATPFAPVDADAGVMVLPVPLDVTLTDAPVTGLLLASRATTVMVLWPPTVIVVGAAETSLFPALGNPAVAVALNVAVPTPDTTAFTLLEPTAGPRVQFVVARPSAFVGVV